ncbi:MAG: hypothetical protein V7707_00560 [Motiliproteus sp.]
MTASPHIVARAPAKTILSGEHAVVYGQPALALAIPRYARVSVFSFEPDSPLGLDRAHPVNGSHCELLLVDLNSRYSLDLSQLSDFSDRCQQRHQRFIDGELPIESVLVDEADLYRYALAILNQEYPMVVSALNGCRIELCSEITIGSGMGSSAATVSALLTAVAGLVDLTLPAERLIALTTRCEMLQHGRSSGLDPAVCARGGLLQFQQGRVAMLAATLDPHWYLVDTGRPSCSTGSCTSQVRQQFGDDDIWLEFGNVTEQLVEALKQRSPAQIIDSLRANHRLLDRIRVVPEPVRRFIDAVEQQGGAAKISGAGAVSGEAGGLVLVYYSGNPDLTFHSLLESSGYSWQPVEQDLYGAQLRD